MVSVLPRRSCIDFRQATPYLACVVFLKSLFRDFTRSSILIVFLTYACSIAATEIPLPDDRKNVRTVFVVHDAWHAAIVTQKSNIPIDVLPELRDFLPPSIWNSAGETGIISRLRMRGLA